MKKIDFGQEELRYVYETAQQRMEAHPELAEKYKKIINDFAFYQNRSEAIEAASELNKNSIRRYQVWAKVDRKEERYLIVDYYVVSNDWKILQAAEYIGMEQILGV